jgi:hypothetical protein
MKAYDGKKLKFQNNLDKKRKRIFVLKYFFFAGLIFIIFSSFVYLLFFSGILEIKNISVEGLDKIDQQEIYKKISDKLNSKLLGILPYQKNIVFFRPNSFKAEILKTFPEIKDISVSKEPPHSLNINIIERKVVGVWCFVNNCKYFDEEGVMWGKAPKSSGFIFIIVEDLRTNIFTIDNVLLKNVLFISDRLKQSNIFIKKFVIPDNFVDDFSIFTSDNYELKLSLDSDIKEQLDALDIFLVDKKNNVDFHPKYIDLRINGRIYYK